MALSCPGHTQTIQDDIGHFITVTPYAQRVVTLSPHTTEIIQAIDATDLLAAVATHSPGIAESVPRISAVGGIDREWMLQLQPDLVIAWASGNKPRDLEWLETQNIRVYRSEPAKLVQLADSMRKIGNLTNRRASAEQAASQFEQALQHACQKPQNTEVYVSIWHRPAMTVGGAHWLNDVLKYAGMRNTYAAIQRGIFSMEAESLISKQSLLRLSSYPPPSGQTGRQRTINTLSRPGPAILQAIQQLCP